MDRELERRGGTERARGSGDVEEVRDVRWSQVMDSFEGGKPSGLFDRNNPDWAPSLKLSASLTPTKSAKKRKQAEVNKTRYIRAEERRKRKGELEGAKAPLHLQVEVPTDEIEVDLPSDKASCSFVKLGRMETPLSNPKGFPTAQLAPFTPDIQAEFQRLLSETCPSN
ncbi:hypothetical protein WMY93_008843 [Mugilogobius chulae]|uniref:Uncharacterized protein n=1 Tax=Mugilogobius chulae TaxID=88201 RepID=A0AAW0P9P3_9GOBI